MAMATDPKDGHLPIANITKIMKSVLPENSKMTKDARELVQECVSEFICFVTGIAVERSAKDKRKTINGQDVIAALHDLGFTDYASVVTEYKQRAEKVEGSGWWKKSAGKDLGF